MRESLQQLLDDPAIPDSVRQALAPEFEEMRQMLARLDEGELHLAVFGRVSVGKSALLNALLGQPLFEVGVLHGTTTRAHQARWEEQIAAGVHFIDTPGINELDDRCEIVVFLDADFSDHPEELPQVVEPILHGDADVVIGSRVLGEREKGALLPQARAGNLVACTLIRLLYGHRYTDLGPFRAARWPELESLGMEDPNFGWTAELQVKALRKGLRVVEVPVSYRKRVGVSKITGTLQGTIRAGYKILWTVFRYSFARL